MHQSAWPRRTKPLGHDTPLMDIFLLEFSCSNLVRLMTSGPIITMELMSNSAVTEWRRLLGPTDSSMARSEAPNSVRARFGTDQTRNACHGSEAVATGQRETSFFFAAPGRWKNTAKFSESSCCVIKPSAVLEGTRPLIIASLKVKACYIRSALTLSLSNSFDIKKTLLKSCSHWINFLPRQWLSFQ